MGLRAVKIVEEEFARWHKDQQDQPDDDLRTLLDQEMERIEARIKERIQKECVEIDPTDTTLFQTCGDPCTPNYPNESCQLRPGHSGPHDPVPE